MAELQKTYLEWWNKINIFVENHYKLYCMCWTYFSNSQHLQYKINEEALAEEFVLQILRWNTQDPMLDIGLI